MSIEQAHRRHGPLAALGVSAACVLAAAMAGQPATAARAQDSSAQTTRVLAWTGGDQLSVAVPADARYVRGADAKVVVTGPKRLVDHIVVDRGVIRYDPAWNAFRWDWGDGRRDRVRIVVTTPALSSAGLSGSGRLDLGRLSQDRLVMSLSGSGVITADGAVRRLEVRISGSGGARLQDIKADRLDARNSGSGWLDVSGASNSLQLSMSGSGRADLGGLKVGDADVTISGSGSARLSARTSAVLTLNGSGRVWLLSEPARLQVRRFGSARVIHSSQG